MTEEAVPSHSPNSGAQGSARTPAAAPPRSLHCSQSQSQTPQVQAWVPLNPSGRYVPCAPGTDRLGGSWFPIYPYSSKDSLEASILLVGFLPWELNSALDPQSRVLSNVGRFCASGTTAWVSIGLASEFLLLWLLLFRCPGEPGVRTILDACSVHLPYSCLSGRGFLSGLLTLSCWGGSMPFIWPAQPATWSRAMEWRGRSAWKRLATLRTQGRPYNVCR